MPVIHGTGVDGSGISEANVTAGGLHVLDNAWGAPRFGVVPMVSSVPCGTMKADAADGVLACLRVTVNPGDDVVAADRLANGTTDTRTVFPDDATGFAVEYSGDDGSITDVYVLVVGDGTGTDAGGDNVIDSSVVKNANGQLATTVGTVVMPDATAAELLAATNMIHLEFDSADAVRDVIIRMGPTLVSGTEAYITVEGRSYA